VRVASRAWWRQAAAILECPAGLRMAVTGLQGGHALGAAARADLGGVLGVADVADVYLTRDGTGRDGTGRDGTTARHSARVHNPACNGGPVPTHHPAATVPASRVPAWPAPGRNQAA
jgi:hypothetical protein